jgi:hypothetical protein
MAKAAVKKEPKSELVILDVVQGSDDWLRARIGIPTASNFSIIMASGKDGGPSITRTKLLHRMAGEILTQEPSPDEYRNAAMDRGNALEDEARQSYAKRKGAILQPVGFAKNFSGLRHCGASPDSLLGFDGGLEVKTAAAHVLIPMLKQPAKMPSEHRCQVQGNMWVCERNWWDVTIYCHRAMPAMDVRVYRDDAFIKELSNEVEKFNFELRRLVDSLKAMGAAG